MYECPSCSAGLTFDPKTQKLECKYCNTKYDISDIEKLHLKEAKNEQNTTYNPNEDMKKYDALVYKCTQCGAELITTDETIATFCSYCGASSILERKAIKKDKPDYVIPFMKTKQECEEAYRKKLKRAFFAPKNMSEEQQIEKIRGIYMPYWIYSFDKEGANYSNGSKCKGRSGDYLIYNDYRLTTNINAKYSGITHDASANFSDSLSEAIAPFSIKDKKEFSPTYLTGFYADSEDVEKDTYVGQSRKIVEEEASKQLKKDKTYRKYNADTDVSMDHVNAELGLFPVYFLATKNKTGDRISYAVVNGQTGKVAAEIPIDFKKYIITSILLAIPIFILLNLFFTLTPTKALIASILFNVISLIIANKQATKIFRREKNLEDKGYIMKEKGSIAYEGKTTLGFKIRSILSIFEGLIMIVLLFSMIGNFARRPSLILIFLMFIPVILSKLKINSGTKKKNIKIEKLSIGERMKKIYKPILGILITITILIIHPVSDLYYYGGAIASIFMTILAFYDIVKQLNLLTTRKLPQLNKRGGDENE